MSWRKISMKFQGTCVVCNEKIEVNEIGLWSKGNGVKHEKCAKIKELKCIICSGPAGCLKCEFREDCNLDVVSELCICLKCNESTDAYSSYLKSVKKQFLLLNI